MPSLPVDPVTGKLAPFDADAIANMAIKRRGVRDGDHCQYNFGPDGSGCTRKFSCAWAERFNAIIYFVGACKTYTELGDMKLSRLVPVKDPDFSKWICTKADITGYQFTGNIDAAVDGSEPLPIFERAELECVFELVPMDVASDDEVVADETERYVTWPGYPGADVSTSTDYIGMPGGILNYTTSDGVTSPAGKPVPFNVGFPESRNNFKVIWRRVPLDAWGPSTTLTQRVVGTEAALGYLGAVNETTFHGYPPLSLQLIGVEQRRLPDPTGLDYSWDIAYVISHKPTPYGQLGLRYFPVDGTSGAYYLVERHGITATQLPADIADGDALFHVREFADLFVVGDVV